MDEPNKEIRPVCPQCLSHIGQEASDAADYKRTSNWMTPSANSYGLRAIDGSSGVRSLDSASPAGVAHWSMTVLNFLDTTPYCPDNNKPLWRTPRRITPGQDTVADLITFPGTFSSLRQQFSPSFANSQSDAATIICCHWIRVANLIAIIVAVFDGAVRT